MQGYEESWRMVPGTRSRTPLFTPMYGRDAKDPCPAYDGNIWHLYGSVGSVINETWRVAHAVAHDPEGPWAEQEPVTVLGIEQARTNRMAAPGVLFESGTFHMFVQTDFLSTHGTIEYLVSTDGSNFERVSTIIASDPDAGEAGLFDAQPAIINKGRYMLYAAMDKDLTGLRFDPEQYRNRVRGPDIHLARSLSRTWAGPWQRLGKILSQEEVPMQCPVGHPDYEWGLEGPQLLELPDGRLLLQSVCFVADRPRGARQRLFLAIADKAAGPYRVLGLLLEPTSEPWQSGEVGHGTVVIADGTARLYYQARSAHAACGDQGEARWRPGLASWPVDRFLSALT